MLEGDRFEPFERAWGQRGVDALMLGIAMLVGFALVLGSFE